MTLDQAIQKLRELDWAAREDWPMGVPEDLADQLREADAAIGGYLDGQPVDDRAEAAKRIIGRIEAREHTATVAPKKRKPA